jgi:hypothetical protein
VQHRLPQRVADPLFDAQLVSGVTRPSYLRRVEGLEDRTVTRDLARLAELGLLEPHGQTCGRYYIAPGELAALRDSLRRQRAPLADPLSSLVGPTFARASWRSRSVAVGRQALSPS